MRCWSLKMRCYHPAFPLASRESHAAPLRWCALHRADDTALPVLDECTGRGLDSRGMLKAKLHTWTASLAFCKAFRTVSACIYW